jgi:hypothetical protein
MVRGSCDCLLMSIDLETEMHQHDNVLRSAGEI